MRSPAILVLAFLLAAAVATGCGAGENKTPVACLEGGAAYLSALSQAPGRVRLRGGVPISGCLIENQKAGDLATVGGAMVSAATRLNGEALTEPGNQANLELGYLLGAAQRGAEGGNGIHTELIRRMMVAARYSPDSRPLGVRSARTYRRGFDAGHSGG